MKLEDRLVELRKFHYFCDLSYSVLRRFLFTCALLPSVSVDIFKSQKQKGKALAQGFRSSQLAVDMTERFCLS